MKYLLEEEVLGQSQAGSYSSPLIRILEGLLESRS
jgi:hypothetical protein